MDRIWTKHKKINPVRSKTPLASADALAHRTSNGVNTTLKPKVFVGMSGGVDSSVAAALLKQEGYAVVGVHLKCWNVDGCAEEDAEDARRAAETLNIPFYVLDFEREYKAAVVNYMVEGYRRGLTPNPDVMCNREIKFGLFLKKAREMGADYIATGHYVRIRDANKARMHTNDANSPTTLPANNSRHSHGFALRSRRLFIAKDVNKDQSYFLWTLTQGQLKYCLFPIGEYTKPQVRALARRFGLPNAEKKDSQGICFLGKVTLADFLGRYIPERRGEILDVRGEKIGEHRGAQFYTIGQRHIGVANRGFTRTGRGTTRTENMKPYYVAEKNMRTNTLVVAEGGDHPVLYRKEVFLRDVHFISATYSNVLKNIRIGGMKVYARVRYRQPLAPATLIYADRTQTAADMKIFPRESVPFSASIRVLFEVPQKAVAPGQSTVFYSRRGELVGGGVIC